MLPSSLPPSGLAGEFSCPYMVRLGPPIIVFYVCREHVLGIINLLSSMGRIRVSFHNHFIGGGHVSCFCCIFFFFFFAKQACLVLWLSKSSFLSNH